MRDGRQSMIKWVAELAALLSRESFDLAMVLIWSMWT